LGVAIVGGTVPMGAAGDGDALVVVNGRAISEKRVADLLMEAHGLEFMQQLIVLELVKAEGKRLGLSVTPGDVEAERIEALNRIAADSEMDPADATEANKLRALETVLQQRGISMTEFLVGMERNAHLRKIVERDFAIDEVTLREEFARTYGERVQVRHIQVSVQNPGRLNEVISLLQRGADFADVARDTSANVETGPRGGELPPFTFTDDRIDPLLREAAFSLTEGEVSTSPVRTDRYYHVLKLDRRIPPDNLKFEDVRGQVEQAVRERVLPARMGELATELFNKASIKVIDPKMRVRYKKFLEQSQGP
jgi:parvulin-like peptidyl-prolyl isomerase